MRYFTVVLLFLIAICSNGQDLNSIYKESIAAYENKDYAKIRGNLSDTRSYRTDSSHGRSMKEVFLAVPETLPKHKKHVVVAIIGINSFSPTSRVGYMQVTISSILAESRCICSSAFFLAGRPRTSSSEPMRASN